ncbi:MAG: DNA topoisomerase (ATP-hydrolyzing) subunit B [Desulfobulbaceae bacterium]|nr:DNA topoisomerase (ATP-hydrolyzing) subunit B [Desulfobulbaceae bacterium]
MQDNNQQQNNYRADQIKVLDGLEAVRKRPAMYIGNTAEDGLHHLIYEVVDNSIDEALAGYCTEISVTIHDNNAVTVEDNGRGIPVDLHPTENISALELVMTTLHAGGKFDHSSYKVSGGLHGVGVSVVNALSTHTVATVRRDGNIYRQSYAYGKRETDLKNLGGCDECGTTIYFEPDPQIFTETIVFRYETIKTRLRELAFLNRNIRINLKDERDGAEDSFFYDGGIVSYVEFLNRNRTAVHPQPVLLTGEKDNVQVEVCLQYIDGYTERLFSFVNNINTKEGGAHVAGFRAALTKCINRYANDDTVPKNLKEKMEGDDVREGLTCIISVRVPNPQFEGQTKTKLGNSEVKSIVETICTDRLTVYLEQNPVVARSILGKVVEAARAREAARRARDLSRKKGTFSVMMAGKLAECQSKNPEERELFIVEGDSAGGSAKQGRDRSVQAILPLRGKIMNVEKARFDKVLSSEEIKQLVASLGTGIGEEEFDLEKLRYHKVIIMTDADVDGAHIRTLLLTFFYRQMLPLIENGHIYIGQPPLYRLGRGKKEQYFLNDEELNNFLYTQASTSLQISRLNSDSFTSENALELLRDLSTFGRLLNYLQRSNIPEDLALFLLEQGVHTAKQFEDMDFVAELAAQLREKKVRTGPIRSCDWRTLCYECNVTFPGQSRLAAVLGPAIPLIQEYRQAIGLYKTIQPYLQGAFTVTKAVAGDKESTIHADNWRALLTLVREETFKGSHLQRYKGLGEMNPEQLWETTMNPVNRTLIQVRIDDFAVSDDMFTTLMGDKVEPRREFIQNNALQAVDLDV